jgi:DNA-binding CsgD family transcriptional regulator
MNQIDPLALTPREREILARLNSNDGLKQIAHAMSLSERTVKLYVSRLHKRYGTSSHLELRAVARDVENQKIFAHDAANTLFLKRGTFAWDKLTAREKQMALFCVLGLKDRETAQRLGLSESMIVRKMGIIIRILGVKNRVDMARYLSERRLVVDNELQIIALCPPKAARKLQIA